MSAWLERSAIDGFLYWVVSPDSGILSQGKHGTCSGNQLEVGGAGSMWSNCNNFSAATHVPSHTPPGNWMATFSKYWQEKHCHTAWHGRLFPTHTRGLGILIGITIKESSVLQQNGFVCIALHADDSTLQEEFEILLGNRPMLHLWTDACPVVHLVNVALWPNLSAAYCHQTTCCS